MRSSVRLSVRAVLTNWRGSGLPEDVIGLRPLVAAAVGGNATDGPPGACRFGSSCVSHGTSGPVRRRRVAAVGRRAGPHLVAGQHEARVEELVRAVGEAALAREADEPAAGLEQRLLVCRSRARPGSGCAGR